MLLAPGLNWKLNEMGCPTPGFSCQKWVFTKAKSIKFQKEDVA
jgi:hypothetical protein